MTINLKRSQNLKWLAKRFRFVFLIFTTLVLGAASALSFAQSPISTKPASPGAKIPTICLLYCAHPQRLDPDRCSCIGPRNQLWSELNEPKEQCLRARCKPGFYLNDQCGCEPDPEVSWSVKDRPAQKTEIAISQPSRGNLPTEAVFAPVSDLEAVAIEESVRSLPSTRILAIEFAANRGRSASKQDQGKFEGDLIVLSRTPYCARVDAVTTRGITSLKVGGSSTVIATVDGFINQVPITTAGQGKALTQIAYIAMSEAEPSLCSRSPAYFAINPRSKQILAGTQIIGTFKSLRTRSKSRSSTGTEEKFVKDSEGGGGNTDKPEKNLADKPVIEKVIRILREAIEHPERLNPIGAAISIFFTPSPIGCGKGENC
jgi:hypothetical protein